MPTRDPYRLGPLLVVVGVAIASVGLVLAQVLGFHDRVIVALAWVILVIAVVFAAVARVLGSVKRRALEVERRIGVPAHAARLEPTKPGRGAGVGAAADEIDSLYRAMDQLPTVDGYASPLHPIITARAGMLEFWRGAEQGEPYATVPLSLVRARLAPDRGPFRAAALQLEVEGMRLPLAVAFYRSGWAAVLPADALEVEGIASELGIRMADRDDEAAGGWSA